MDMIKEVRCHSADDFLNHLLPSHPFWQDQQHKWIFRGQSDSRWQLIPSVFRKSSWEKFAPIDPLELTVRELIKVEFKVLKDFYRICDSNCLSLPEDSQIIRCGFLGHEPEKFIETQFPNLGSRWPPEVINSIVAIAQHHGIPTRLLDWTTNPFIAGYFATKEGAKVFHSSKDELAREIAVFALNSELLFKDKFDNKGNGLFCITAPYGPNKNLGALKGIFTLLRETPVLHSMVRNFPLEEVVSKLENTSSLGCNLIKFILPADSCAELLRKLHGFGVSAGSLFPDIAGSVEALREEFLWDKNP